MAFQISPGVNVTEVDLTTIIPAVSTSTGGIAGRFQWGPAMEATSISNENQLVATFGKPDANTAEDFFTAANFLAYATALRVVRVIDTATDGSGATNAQETPSAAGDPGVLLRNDTDADTQLDGVSNTFFARHPGALGNELTVEMCDGNVTVFDSWAYSGYFDGVPGTSAYAAARGSSNDEIHVAVIDSSIGHFSGTANQVLEIYPFMSKASDGENASGDNVFFKSYINNKSAYIRIGSASAATNTDYGKSATVHGNSYNAIAHPDGGIISTKLSGGKDGLAEYTAAIYNNGYDLFADTEKEDVSLLMAGSGGDSCSEAHKTTVIKNVITLAGTRKDAVAFYSPHYSDIESSASGTNTTEVKEFRTSTINEDSNYAFMDSGWKYQYDKYSDLYRWVPLNGDIAGIAARTDNDRDPWWSPAGFNRGHVKNVVKLAYNPSKTQRDTLYAAQINPVVTIPGQGTILFGDKTTQNRPSAFDRINVRRLFIVLEKAISTAAKFSLFEFNDDFTRSQFVNMVEPFLRSIQGRRGITDFRVICDGTNNTPAVIDANQFVGDIYVKPVRSINFIQLNFVAVSTGVDFSEVVGRF